MRYRLDKTQVKMLLNDKPLRAGRRSIRVGGEIKDAFKLIDDNNLYHKYDIIVDMDDGAVDIFNK